jgi:hypothetical protein
MASTERDDLDQAFAQWFDGLPPDCYDDARRAWDKSMQAQLIRLRHAQVAFNRSVINAILKLFRSSAHL